jgi:hypothetical protein
MLHLLKPKPGEKQRENPFKDIKEMPWWQIWLEVVVYAAAVVGLGEFLWRLFW